MGVDQTRGRFGERREREKERAEQPEEAPVPVLHVGEVHAELRLHITTETLSDLGSQIGSMVASAIAQGVQAGMAAGMAAVEAGEDLDEGGILPAGVTVARNDRAAGEPVLTDEDIRRARGE